MYIFEDRKNYLVGRISQALRDGCSIKNFACPQRRDFWPHTKMLVWVKYLDFLSFQTSKNACSNFFHDLFCSVQQNWAQHAPFENLYYFLKVVNFNFCNTSCKKIFQISMLLFVHFSYHWQLWPSRDDSPNLPSLICSDIVVSSGT